MWQWRVCGYRLWYNRCINKNGKKIFYDRFVIEQVEEVNVQNERKDQQGIVCPALNEFPWEMLILT